ncbi:cache domain-containing sensor histidine kinase [Paenibacillus favisporus]|uniref:cache domain-containing sensor histidine kinase n=1 Tax=Paenibacillus favisporus TaxID=221028 RepID=UPI003D27E624
MRLFQKWFIRNSSVQNKFLFSTWFLILIPLGLFGIITFQVSKQSIEYQVNQLNLKTLGQISEKTDMLLDDIISISNSFYLNSAVTGGFTSKYAPGSFEEAQIRSTFDQLLANSIYSFGSLKFDVVLLGLNGLELSTGNTSLPDSKTLLQNIMQQDWYQKAINVKGKILWITEPIPGLSKEGDRSVYAVRVSNRFFSWEPIGLVMIRIDVNALKGLYASSLNKNQEIMLMDNGKVISSGNSKFAAAVFKNRAYYNKINDYDSGYFVDKEAGSDQLVSFQTIGKTGWKLVSFTPKSTVLASINQIQTIVIIAFAAVVLLSFAASYIMARRLAIPIKRLYKDIGRVEEGNLSVKSPVYSHDEIGLLTEKFNEMVVKLSELMEDVTREQQQKRQAELQTLQSQINPHFMYNTLASIRFMLYTREPETVDSVIVALVKLLKQSVSRQDELIPVEEELDIVKNYLYIQQIRQGDKLNVHFDIENRILAYQTIKLILQPLVENAIFHGLEPKHGQGTLVIRGYESGKDLVFEVADDGVGLNPEMLGSILTQKTAADGITSHNGGFRNVHERIQLHFGAQYGLTFESAEGKGTKVFVRIPAFYAWKEVRRI